MKFKKEVKIKFVSADLKLPAEVGEEFHPELAVVHVVQAHLLLGVVVHSLPLGVPVTPGAWRRGEERKGEEGRG